MPGLSSMPLILEKITSIYSLIAFAVFLIACIVYFARRARGKDTTAVVSIIAIALVALAALLVFGPTKSYEVRVTTVDEKNSPVSDANVFCSVGGESLKPSMGQLYTIPGDKLPETGRITFYATKESAFLKGSTEITLGKDHHPTCTIVLRADNNAEVRGIVLDEQNHAVKDALVSVVGYDQEAVRSGSAGGFVLPAHKASGQQVKVHAEKQDYVPAVQWELAGKTDISLQLKKLNKAGARKR